MGRKEERERKRDRKRSMGGDQMAQMENNINKQLRWVKKLESKIMRLFGIKISTIGLQWSKQESLHDPGRTLSKCVVLTACYMCCISIQLRQIELGIHDPTVVLSPNPLPLPCHKVWMKQCASKPLLHFELWIIVINSLLVILTQWLTWGDLGQPPMTHELRIKTPRKSQKHPFVLQGPQLIIPVYFNHCIQSHHWVTWLLVPEFVFVCNYLNFCKCRYLSIIFGTL